MTDLPVFRYFVVPTRAACRHSMFQLFDGAWLAAIDYVAQAVQCPCTIRDLQGTCRERTELRALGLARHWIAVVPATTMERMHHPPPFMVLFTSSETDNWGRSFIGRHSEPVLHIPENYVGEEIGRAQVSRELFLRFSERVLDHMSLYNTTDLPVIRPEPTEAADASQFPRIVVPPYIRTAPNHAALMSVGHPNIDVVPEAEPCDKTDDAARLAFEAVVSFRRSMLAPDLYPPGLTNILISAAGLSRRLRDVIRARDNSSDSAHVARAFRMMRRFRGLDLIPPHLVAAFEEHSMATDVLMEREFEIRGQATAAMVESCGQVLPTVLLQNGLGKPMRDRKAIADSLRHRGEVWRNTDLDAVRHLGRSLASSIPQYVMDYLTSDYGTVKALVDEPIELMAMEGRPLSMKRPVVRVPVTPGLVLTRQTTTAAPLILERRDFNEILILRGTSPADPVYPWLEAFSQGMAQQTTGVRILTVDVRTESDVMRALERFEGAMMAFDAHGIHLAGQIGCLEIGDELITLHDVHARFPPIVFLASCETHAIGRAEETVSAALLNAGVRCVVGTMASVSARAAGLLFSDLIGRATQSQPAYGGLLRWSELFAASLWACHAIEAATILAQSGVIEMSPQQVGQFADRLEQSLLRFHRDWFAAACRELSDMCGVDADIIKHEWERRAYVTDCSMFCQLGQPDTIFLAPLHDPSPFAKSGVSGRNSCES